MILKSLMLSIFLVLPCWATSPIMIGYVQNGQNVKISGTAYFYKQSVNENLRSFAYSNDGQELMCQASFFELGPKQIIALESITPRLKVIVGNENIPLNDIPKIKWKAEGDHYTFSAKLKIRARQNESLPFYIHIPDAPNAQVRGMGYIGNTCNAPLSSLPQDWNLSNFDYIDQDQQEYSVSID